MVKTVNDQELERRLIKSNGFVLVAFLSRESIPSKHFLPEFKMAADRLSVNEGFNPKGGIEYLMLDVDENPSEADALDIQAVPTTILFHESKKLGVWEGPYSAEAIFDRVLQAVRKKV